MSETGDRGSLRKRCGGFFHGAGICYNVWDMDEFGREKGRSV
jgi:hypothetical protein